MTGGAGRPDRVESSTIRDKDAEEKLLDRFRDPPDPLKFVIVTAQAADRLRRAHPAGDVSRQADEGPQPAAGHLPHQPHLRPEKTHGLIVDYIGIFDDVARALDFDEKAVQQVVSNIDELRRPICPCGGRSAWPSSPAWTAPSAATRG